MNRRFAIMALVLVALALAAPAMAQEHGAEAAGGNWQYGAAAAFAIGLAAAFFALSRLGREVGELRVRIQDDEGWAETLEGRCLDLFGAQNRLDSHVAFLAFDLEPFLLVVIDADIGVHPTILVPVRKDAQRERPFCFGSEQPERDHDVGLAVQRAGLPDIVALVFPLAQAHTRQIPL